MTTNIVSTLTIRISERSGSYYIEASGLGTDVKSLPFAWTPTKDDLGIIELLHSDPEKVSEEQLIALGQTLYKSVFTPEILIAYHQINRNLRSGNGIRIRLVIESKNLSHIPWEVMHDGQDFVSLYSEYPLVRGTRESFHVRQSAVSGPIRILYVWSEPKDLPPLKLSNPAEEIRKLVSPNKRIKFEILPNATVISLRKALLSQYHIVCFAGHGDEKHIYLETLTGYEKLTAKELARELEGRPVQLVFLAACKTAGTQSEGLASFAHTLANETQIPAIAAMQYEISDDQANLLTARYFETIANFRPLDVALAESRKALLKERNVLRDVFAPVIYLQSKTSNLFQRARNWWAIGFAVIAIIAICLATIFGAQFGISSIRVGFANATAQAAATARAEAQALAEIQGTARANAEIEAEQQSSIARSGELAELATSLKEKNPVASLLLAIEAFNLDDNLQTRNTLMANTQAYSHIRLFGNYMVISPNGKMIASSLLDDIYLIDAGTGEYIDTLEGEGPGNSINQLLFNRDSTILLSTAGAENNIFLWDVNKRVLLNKILITEEAMKLVPLDLSEEILVFNPTDQLLVIKNEYKFISIWQVTEQKQICRTQSQYITNWAYNPQTNRIAVVEYDEKTLQIRDANTCHLINQYKSSNVVNQLTFSPDGSNLGSHDEKLITIWDTLNGQILSTIPLTEPEDWPFPLLSFNNNAQILAIEHRNGKTDLWDIHSNSKLSTINSFGRVIGFSPDDQYLNTGAALLYLDDNPNPRVLTPGIGVVHSVAFNFDGTILASGGLRKIFLWNVANGEIIQVLDGHEENVTRLSFSDWQTLQSTSMDGVQITWDVSNGNQISTETNQTSYDDARSADGRILLIQRGLGYPPVLWDTQTDSQIGAPLVGLDYIEDIDFYYSENLLVAGGSDGTVWLYDINNGQAIAQFIGHTRSINSVAFSPDGKLIASGSNDGTLRIWNIDPLFLLEEACQKSGRNFTITEWKTYFPDEQYPITCPQWPKSE